MYDADVRRFCPLFDFLHNVSCRSPVNNISGARIDSSGVFYHSHQSYDSCGCHRTDGDHHSPARIKKFFHPPSCHCQMDVPHLVVRFDHRRCRVYHALPFVSFRENSIGQSVKLLFIFFDGIMAELFVSIGND